MATTTDTRSAAELRAEKAERVAGEQAKLDEARERVKAEAPEAASEPAAASNGRATGPRVDGQDGLFDREIENPELLEALEAREKVKASRSALNAKFKEADEQAKGLIAGLGIGLDDVVRVGRFRLQKSKVDGKSVAFETEPSERLTISPIDD